MLGRARHLFADDSTRDTLTAKNWAARSRQTGSGAWFANFQGNLNEKMHMVKGDVVLTRNPKELWSAAEIAEPGDLLRVYRKDSLEKETNVFFMVYLGEESFPDTPNRSFSFFIYPYRTRLEYNTLPARLHDQYVQTRSQQFQLSNLTYANFSTTAFDSARNVKWLRPNAFKRSVFLKTKAFDGRHYLDVYRTGPTGRFDGFTPEQVTVLQRALDDALKLNRRCISALSTPSSATRQLAEYAFQIGSGATAEQRLTEIKSVFEGNDAALRNVMFKFAPPESLTAFDTKAAWDPEHKLLLIDDDFFEDDYLKFKASGGDKGFYQAHMLLHEALHSVFPAPAGADEQASSFGGHWGGLVDYESAAFNEPTLLMAQGKTVEFPDAIRNPYCFQFFAIWRSKYQAQHANVAKELFDFLLSYKYENILLQEPINFGDPNLPQGGCQDRAQAMLVAIREFAVARGQSFDTSKIFSIGSGFQSSMATITPIRNGTKLTNIKWGFHVAPMVLIGDTNLVFDPSLSDHPVSPRNWELAQEDPGGLWTDVVECSGDDPGKWAFRPSASAKPPQFRDEQDLVTYEQAYPPPSD